MRVVVRDKDGKAVGGLTKDDFRLSDNGKPQSVTLFEVETYKAAEAVQPLGTAPPAAKSTQPVEVETSPELPQRYVALYFDDLVVKFEDMTRVRAAADKYIDSALQPRGIAPASLHLGTGGSWLSERPRGSTKLWRNSSPVRE